jgi:hypothetical protein
MKTIKPRQIKIFDNGGRSFDRYTVIYPKQKYELPYHKGAYYPYIAMSEHPMHPQGFGQHGELQPPGRYGFKCLGKRITFDDLPEDCQKVVMRELSDFDACIA